MEADADDETFGFTLGDALKVKRYRIMQHMGWNYWEYSRAPASLINEIWAFMTTEGKARADQQAAHAQERKQGR